MGCGVVGSGVVEMLMENKKILTGTVGDELRVLYMLDLRDLAVPEGVILTKNFEDILADERVQIVVETMGGTKFAYPYTKQCLEAGKHVVTSNKELVADFGDELLAILGIRRALVGIGNPMCNARRAQIGICARHRAVCQHILKYVLVHGASFSVRPRALSLARILGRI